MTSIALVTVYHFNSGHGEAYARLIRGLRSSVRQLVDRDRLILVANGVDDGAEDPDQVVKDVDASHPERIVPVVISNNVRAAGGLNVGVEEALLHQCEWIGQVQSSVVIGSRWLEAIRSQANSSMIHGLGGRLVCEEQTDLIWTDGHYLEKGQTKDIRYGKPLGKPGNAQDHWMFPCLSAALFSAKTVGLVREKYGDFVTEQLSHYGDCTDVALRCARLGCGTFSSVADAVGTKRRPTHKRAAIVCSHLLAAQRYYQGHFEEACERLRGRPSDVRFYQYAVRRSIELHAARYSPTGAHPPAASKKEDQKWG